MKTLFLMLLLYVFSYFIRHPIWQTTPAAKMRYYSYSDSPNVDWALKTFYAPCAWMEAVLGLQKEVHVDDAGSWMDK